uniref:Putative secreted protein n=1 Tax=Ixodes ricinus TaxID=34613 RepID=A0A6B0UCM5_IXORI
MAQSTSSSWMMMSFLRILMAYNSSVPLRSASSTLPKLPLPSTMRKWKSEARITSCLPMLCGTSGKALGVPLRAVPLWPCLGIARIWLRSADASSSSAGTGTL